MKQKVWAMGNDYVVRDEAGNDRFIVDGRRGASNVAAYRNHGLEAHATMKTWAAM